MDFLETALDTAVKGRYVDLSVLTQDENGRTSQQFRSGEDQKQPDLEEGKKTPGKSFYRKISQSDNCDVSYYCLHILLQLQALPISYLPFLCQ